MHEAIAHTLWENVTGSLEDFPLVLVEEASQ